MTSQQEPNHYVPMVGDSTNNMVSEDDFQSSAITSTASTFAATTNMNEMKRHRETKNNDEDGENVTMIAHLLEYVADDYETTSAGIINRRMRETNNGSSLNHHAVNDKKMSADNISKRPRTQDEKENPNHDIVQHASRKSTCTMGASGDSHHQIQSTIVPSNKALRSPTWHTRKKSFTPSIEARLNQRSLAPSIEAYLNQVPELLGDENMTAKNKKKKDEQNVFLKYFPRPEWCGPLFYLMRKQLIMDIKVYNRNNPQHRFHEVQMINVVKMQNVDDFDQHLYRCVTNHPAAQVVQHFYEKNKKTMSKEYCYDDNGKVVQDHPSKNRNSNVDNQNDVADKKDGVVGKCHKKALAFVKSLLQSNIIYFDIDGNKWKTRKKVTTVDSENMTISSPLEFRSRYSEYRYQITYKELIQRQRRVNKSGMNRHTILHMAIEANATDVALDMIRIEYNTFRACPLGYLECSPDNITFLEMTNHRGVTPLILAAQKGNLQVVKKLLYFDVASSMRWTGSALLQAAHFGHTEVIECLIEYYSDIEADDNYPYVDELLDHRNANGTTSLMRAAREGHVAAAQILLLYGTHRINLQNHSGMTPLMFAAQRGQLEMCRLLIQEKADMNLHTNKNYSTALLLACRRGHIDVVKELLAAGCELHHTNFQHLTARQVVLNRMQRRAAAPTFNPHHEGRRHMTEVRRAEDGDDGIGFAENDIHSVSNESDEKIIRMLTFETQIELMQSKLRVQRNYDIIYHHTLLQTGRATIIFRDNSFVGFTISVDWWPRKPMTTTPDSDSLVTSSNPVKPPSRQLSKHLLPRCGEMLVRTMELPAPLAKTITLFLPLPNLWEQRINRLFDFDDPNDVIINALDIIDEILEEGGFLSACEKAQIPAPNPHHNWYDWKRSAKGRTIWSSTIFGENSDVSNNNNTTSQQRRSVTASLPPLPEDVHHPTIRELRRWVGYSTVLSQYQSRTNIVNILREHPFNMPMSILDRLIRIADLASICRRCCIEPRRASVNADFRPDIQFEPNAASDILELASDLLGWADERST